MSTKALNNRPTEEVVVKKCCASGARMDTKRKICTGINRVEFKYDVINTITNVTQKSYKMKHFRHNYKFCQGKLISDENFKVTQKGILMNFTNIGMERYIYNDFCVDVDFESGRSVFIICENYVKFKKCCKLNSLLKKIDGEYHCVRSKKLVYLTDTNEIFGTNDQLPNIEVIIENYGEFKFKMNISNVANQKIIKGSNTCIDKEVVNKWVQLEIIEHHIPFKHTELVAIPALIIMLLAIGAIICALRRCHPTFMNFICPNERIFNCFMCVYCKCKSSNIRDEENAIQLQIISTIPDWKVNIKKIIDDLKENLENDDYMISIREERERKELKIENTASTSKQEEEPLMKTNLSNGGKNQDSPDNDDVKQKHHSKLPSVAELVKIFESENKPKKTVDLNDEVKIKNHLKGLLEDLTQSIETSEALENSEELREERMIHAMQLLAKLDQVSSRNYLEIYQWNFEEAAVLWLVKSS
jgi:hypothetical protein